MSRWRVEGGRSMTLYVGAFVELFWLAVAVGTLAAVAAVTWVKAPGRPTDAEILAIALMLSWTVGLAVILANA